MSNYNGCANSSHVYEWCDSDGPRYVGWGVVGHVDGSMPWVRRWAARADDPSPLGAWLRSLVEPPALSWERVPWVALTASAAYSVAALRRRQLRRLGVKLLADRRYAGSGPMRGTHGHRSMRAASIALGIPLTTLWRQLRRST